MRPALEKSAAQAYMRGFRMLGKHAAMKVVARRLHGIPDLTRNKPSKDWALLIVIRPDGWKPTSHTDIPPVLKFLDVDSTYVTAGKARGVAIAFNLASMANNGRTWAIPMQIEGMPRVVRMGKGGAR